MRALLFLLVIAALASTDLQQVQSILATIPNVTLDEAMELLGPGHNYNVSSTGIITLDSGRYQLPDLEVA